MAGPWRAANPQPKSYPKKSFDISSSGSFFFCYYKQGNIVPNSIFSKDNCP